MDTRIYICTHKTYTKPQESMYRFLHVGHAISTDLGYEGDDTSDHISDRNKSFCELTGLYWIWKNVHCDIVGICHYRRYFIEDEDFLTQNMIEATLQQGYDAILPTSSFTNHSNVEEQYAAYHHRKDLATLREIVSELYPTYLMAFDLVMHCSLMSAWNMLITKKNIFDDYCAWLFPILFEAERRIDISQYDTYQARLFGYLSERLLRVFFLQNTYRIRECEVKLMNPEDAYNQQKTLAAKTQLLRLKINDLLTIYHTGNRVNLVEMTPAQLDFHEKLPVWVLWWQGFENAPELVQVCRESWYKKLPADLVEIHEITMDNAWELVTLPDWIKSKFDQGKISYAHLSDIYRMALLYLYGGLWMDATYFLADIVPTDYLHRAKTFFTLRVKKAHWKTDVTQGQWSCNFIGCTPGALLPQFVMNAFFYYFIENEEVIDYYMFDHLIRIAYEDFSEVREMIDSCPYTEPGVMELQKLLRETFHSEEFSALTKDTHIFKLNYRTELTQQDILGRKTVWSFISSAFSPEKT